MKKGSVCSVDNCEGVAWCRGLCSVHYNRLRASLPNGLGGKNAKPLEVRLWKKIDKRGPDECWLWTAKSRLSGYGWIGTQSGTHKLAHRAVWELTYGPIPESDNYHGTVVMHTCDNRLCCNPAHLRLGTQADNVHDMRDKKRNVDLPTRKGTDHPRAKINPEIVRAIRDRSNTVKRLNELYGVNKAMVDNVRRGRTWSHVP